MKKFSYIIGNPPYQSGDQSGLNKQFAAPIYDKFLEESFKVANCVELIHPARFLFNAGSTPKDFNERMLKDEHYKVLLYEPDCTKIFPSTMIKGGIAITYHDKNKIIGPINVFTKFSELNTIMEKTKPENLEHSLMSIIYVQNKFNLPVLYKDHPEYKNVIGSNGMDKRFRNNSFEKIPLFSDSCIENDDIPVFGVIKNKRVWKYLPKKYFDLDHENLFKWKVLVARVNGTGGLNEILSNPLVAAPISGYTQTFIGIGAFDTQDEAKSALKYVKSKFARVMLGILKVTQDNNRETWAYVPLQNFSSSSDIDWSKSIHEIDLQLYKKYGLDDKEIRFIESHVKEMS